MPALALAWVFYLSLVTVGQEFLSFQWDILLLEIGFSGNFSGSMARRSSRLGVAKLGQLGQFSCLDHGSVAGALASVPADVSFGRRKALKRRPNLAQLDGARIPLLDAASAHARRLVCGPIAGVVSEAVAGIFALELGVPFLIFTPRRFRRLGAGLIAGFQLLIALTGNYCFFNLLTIVPLRSASRRLVFQPLAAGAAGRLFCGKRFGRSARAGRNWRGKTHVSARAGRESNQSGAGGVDSHRSAAAKCWGPSSTGRGRAGLCAANR